MYAKTKSVSFKINTELCETAEELSEKLGYNNLEDLISNLLHRWVEEQEKLVVVK